MTPGIERIMGRSLSNLSFFIFLALVGTLGVGQSNLLGANLSKKTVDAFNRYVEAAEARMKREESQPNDFLYIETLPRPQYEEILSTIEHGGIYVQPLRTLDAKGKPINIPGGMIHHWVGDVFIPGKSVSSALDVLRDYDNFKKIYAPEVIRSRLISRRDDDEFNVYLRLQKKSIVTVTLDTWYNIRFTPVGNNRGFSRSISTRIQQVEDAGTRSEHLDSVGHDSGYLWRINSYWRYEERNNGVIIEWESISLSRPIPFLIAWFVKPLVRSIARQTVQSMLTATRKAVQTEKSQKSKAENRPRTSGLVSSRVRVAQRR